MAEIELAPTEIAPEIAEKPFLTRAALGIFYSSITVLIGATLWGLISYFTGSIYFFIPILIGMVITGALFSPFKRVPFLLAALLFIPCVILTVVSALLGDYIFYTLSLAKELEIGLLVAAQGIAENFIMIISEERQTLVSGLLAIVGAVIGFFNAVR